ncbi:hypothetical protein ACVWWN_006459 [Mycobacterium sp. URHB0021]|jgi:hypothetical protein
MAKDRAGGGGRLSGDDWTRPGYVILANEGIKDLEIDRLCKRLGVTKGSFYLAFHRYGRLSGSPGRLLGGRSATRIDATSAN